LVKLGGPKKTWKMYAILQNVIEKSFMNWRVLPLVKIDTRISDTPCIVGNNAKMLVTFVAPTWGCVFDKAKISIFGEVPRSTRKIVLCFIVFLNGDGFLTSAENYSQQ
jgi:hypothetical protein